MENDSTIAEKYYDFLMVFGPKIIGALITLLLGLWIIGILKRTIAKQLEKKDMEPSLRGFVNSLLGITLKLMLFVSVIGMVGVQMTSFIAIIGAAGLAVGK